jgi:hypothetical protein
MSDIQCDIEQQTEPNMKTLIAVAAAFLVASIGLAAETTSQPASAPADSPLVRAAKRANRLGRKPGFVITNDNMHTLAGPARMTTTDHVPNAPVISAAPALPPEVVARKEADAAKAVSDAAAAVARVKEQQQRQRMERAAAEAEGSDAIYVEDPAQSEHAMNQASQPASSSSPQASQNTTRPRP